MITEVGLKRGVRMMSLMKFFPADEDARLALMELLGEMCHDDAEIEWLARRMRHKYNEWPGSLELRAMLSSKRTPKDGIEAGSSIYPDGIPSEREGIGSEKLFPLPSGAIASADPEMETLVRDLAIGKQLGASKQNLYQFELNVHYATLKMLGATDLIQAVLRNSVSADQSGMVEYAKRLWHGIFQDFQELRSMFPDHAAQFGPYNGAAM